MCEGIPLPDLNLDECDSSPYGLTSQELTPLIHDPQDSRTMEFFGFNKGSSSLIHCSMNSHVYRYDDEADDTTTILKISVYKKRLMNEFGARCFLPQSKYLVQYFDVYEYDSSVLLQMEYCKLGDIRLKKLNERESWKLIHDIGSALVEVHNRNFLHLDVSPANILCDGENFKLGDFGSMIRANEYVLGCEGSGPYLSPEILESSENVTYSTDIFSFGIVLLEVASGFLAPRGGDIRYDYLRKEQISLGSLNYKCDFSNTFINIVNKMLSRDPNNRPTALDLVIMSNEYGCFD